MNIRPKPKAGDVYNRHGDILAMYEGFSGVAPLVCLVMGGRVWVSPEQADEAAKHRWVALYRASNGQVLIERKADV